MSQRETFRILIALLAGLISLVTSASNEAAWMGVADAQAVRIPEPVYGGDLMVYRAGPSDAPAVVLIHGLGYNGAKVWAETVPALTNQYQVIAVDQPGFGLSSGGNHHYTPQRQAEAIAAALRKLKIGRHALVGHSHGAAVALAYAHQYPERVQRLALISMAGILHRAVYAEYLSRLGALYFTGIYPQDNSWFGGMVRQALRSAEQWASASGWVLESEWFRREILQSDANAIAAYALVEQDFSRALRELRRPTHLIWGATDPVAPVRTGYAAAAQIDGARLTVLDGLAHVPMFEAPNTFNASLLAALSETEGRSVAHRLPESPPRNGRTQRCEGLPQASYRGEIQELLLINCGDVFIENANIGRINSQGSRLRLRNTHVHGPVQLQQGFLEVTGGSLHAPVSLDRSNADLAGVRMQPEVSLHNHGQVRIALNLSVSTRLDVQAREHALHESVILAPSESY